MSKYEPLQHFLEGQKLSRISLSVGDVEKIIGADLPASAVKHQAWWANNPTGHSHSRAWIDAGWRTENVNLASGKVDFVRDASVVPAPKSDRAAKGTLWGSLAGTVTIHDADALLKPIGETWDAAR